MTKTSKAEEPLLFFATPLAWAEWLRENHAQSKGLWLKMAKKESKIESLDYAGALRAALCWGWIDSQTGSIDAQFWKQRFTPRGPKSVWSKVNREHVAALISSGEMQAPGLAEVEKAKQDGRWEAAYDPPSRAAVPDDLAAALAQNPAAKEFFETLRSANRYAILYRLQAAKKPETRAKNLEKFVAMLARKETLHG